MKVASVEIYSKRKVGKLTNILHVENLRYKIAAVYLFNFYRRILEYSQCNLYASRAV